MKHIQLDNQFEFHVELRTTRDPSGALLYHEKFGQDDLEDLVDEAFARGVIEGKIPPAPDSLRVSFVPSWDGEPRFDSLVVVLRAEVDGKVSEFAWTFRSGRWLRRCIWKAAQLRKDGLLPAGEDAFPLVYAHRSATANQSMPASRLDAPEITDVELADLGVKSLGVGELQPDRPVLISERALEDMVRFTEEAGADETGAAVLGRMIRLQKALEGASTRVVTVLTAVVRDERHQGQAARFDFSPEALVTASEIAGLRGFGETVQTVFHSHGWGSHCSGNCHENVLCPLVECTHVSLQDYRLLESLFPGKATVMPIGGRKLGAPGRRPVVVVHSWTGGEMRPVEWRSYRD